MDLQTLFRPRPHLNPIQFPPPKTDQHPLEYHQARQSIYSDPLQHRRSILNPSPQRHSQAQPSPLLPPNRPFATPPRTRDSCNAASTLSLPNQNQATKSPSLFSIKTHRRSHSGTKSEIEGISHWSESVPNTPSKFKRGTGSGGFVSSLLSIRDHNRATSGGATDSEPRRSIAHKLSFRKSLLATPIPSENAPSKRSPKSPLQPSDDLFSPSTPPTPSFPSPHSVTPSKTSTSPPQSRSPHRTKSILRHSSSSNKPFAISSPTLLNTLEQRNLARLEGFESMSIVSDRVYGKEEGAGGKSSRRNTDSQHTPATSAPTPKRHPYATASPQKPVSTASSQAHGYLQPQPTSNTRSHTRAAPAAPTPLADVSRSSSSASGGKTASVSEKSILPLEGKKQKSQAPGHHQRSNRHLGTHDELDEDADGEKSDATDLGIARKPSKKSHQGHNSLLPPPKSGSAAAVTASSFLDKEQPGPGPYLNPSTASNQQRRSTHSQSGGHGHGHRRNPSTGQKGRFDSNVSVFSIDQELAGGAGGVPHSPGLSELSRDEDGFRANSLAEGVLRGNTLAGLYLVSGLPKDVKQWVLADPESTKGMETAEDSMGVFWKSEILGRSFAGQNPNTLSSRITPQASTTSLIGGSLRGAPSVGSFDEGAISGSSMESALGGRLHRLVAKTLKHAHPKEVEVINSNLIPQATTHFFSFNLPAENTSKAARKLGRDETSPYRSVPDVAGLPSAKEDPLSDETTWYGVSLLVWHHVGDKDRASRLNQVRKKLAKAKAAKGGASEVYGEASNIFLGTSTATLVPGGGKGSRATSMTHRSGEIRRVISIASTDMDSENDFNHTDSEVDRFGGRNRPTQGRHHMNSFVSDPDHELAAFREQAPDTYYVPYAITLVSRHPIFDCLNDYLRLSWGRFAKNSSAHSLQMSRILNYPTPKPGDRIQLLAGLPGDANIEVACDMPGSIDLRSGFVFVNLPLHSLWQMLSIESVLECMEVALTTGKVVFVSKYPHALGVAATTLRYLCDLKKGWKGLCIPLLHSRDTNFCLEAPGPYIVGMPAEFRKMTELLPDTLICDLDMNHIAGAKDLPPGVISPRPMREKWKRMLLDTFGPTYVSDANVPTELKLSFPSGKLHSAHAQPIGFSTSLGFLGEPLRPPTWFKAADVVAVIDKILSERSKKPTFMQKLFKPATVAKPLKTTPSEEMARIAMKNRALHYIEARDLIELKVARVQKRLISLVHEGENWRKRFEQFEKYAEQLAKDAEGLKEKIATERREAKRLSGQLNQTAVRNTELHDKLAKTEVAREEAMRQLSDMAESMSQLEHERDLMLNAIEAQLEQVMIGQLDDQSEAGGEHLKPLTPHKTGDGHEHERSTVSPSAWKHGDARPRRGTIVTIASIGDTHTIRSDQKAESVIGALGTPRKKRFSINTSGSTRDPLRQLDQSIHFKSQQMAEKFNAIQSKLDAALQAVSAHAQAEEEAEQRASMDGTPSEEPDVNASPDDRTGGEKNLPVDDDEEAPTPIATKPPAMPESFSTKTLVEIPPDSPHTVHRVRSHAVMATITTVIKMEGRGHSRSRSIESTSVATFNPDEAVITSIKQQPGGGPRSRVSLVPTADGVDQVPGGLSVEEEEEWLSAGSGDAGGKTASVKTRSSDGTHSVKLWPSPQKEKAKRAGLTAEARRAHILEE